MTVKSTVLLDKDGFLENMGDWNTGLAQSLAEAENIELTDAHWEIIHLLRDYYQQYDSSPAMRPLVKFCGLKLGLKKAKSIYLLALFPGSPAKIGSKIAGLPRPDNCL